MLSLSDGNQDNIIRAFNSTYRYLNVLLHINNKYFKQVVDTIYPKVLLLNKFYTSDIEAPFLDLN